jgi:hypothetical protein
MYICGIIIYIDNSVDADYTVMLMVNPYRNKGCVIPGWAGFGRRFAGCVLKYAYFRVK